MSAAPLPFNESERLEKLATYNILDTLPEESFERVTRLAAKLIGTPIVLISLVDRDRQWFKSRVGLDAQETPRDLAFCAHTILGSDVMVVADATQDERFADNPLVTGQPNIRFYAGAPLKTPEGLNMGTLCAIDRVARTLTEEEIQVLRDLSRIVMQELELRRMASFDVLTDLPNRRYFDDYLAREHRRAQRQGSSYVVILADIDHFKAINDTYGHNIGDRVLQRFAYIVRQELRESDIVARYGGEEFVFLLPDTHERGGQKVAEHLRRMIESFPMATEKGEIAVTASFGVTECVPKSQSSAEALANADKALYAAKSDGRNRVSVAVALL